MKIVYHDPEGDVTYTRIARVDFSPGVDMTLNSLPVDTLTVDIITPDTLERGWYVSLMDDMDTLFAKFRITKIQRVNADTLRVEAMSPLGLLDWWTVGAERIDTTAATAINDLFNGLPKSGYLSIVPYVLPGDLGSVYIDGFAPEQTARERLLWLCLCMGAWVQQSFCAGLVFHALPDFSNYNLNQGTLIPPARTYWQPDTQLGDPVYEVQVEFINSISTTEDYPDMQSGTDESGTPYYWNVGMMGYINPDADAPGGSEVKIQGISLMHTDYQQPSAAKIQALYQNRMEITAEIIDNGDIQPGDVVRVYTDEDKIYCGVVKQCAFTFGQQAKARLTVNAFPDALPIQTVRVLYTADGVPLGQHTEVYPEGDTWEIENPEIDGYTPDSPSISGSTGGTYTEDYTKIPLVWIEAHNNSFTQYLEGADIDYRGLLVLGWQTAKISFNQIPWTNGGQWHDGKIPFSALTLPVKKAVYDETKAAQTPGASVQTIPVQYIEPGTGDVYEDTFNVLVFINEPASIQVTAPPKKIKYRDGEAIDFTGMVVTAYGYDGNPWTNNGQWPGGRIPLEELSMDKYADFGKGVLGHWESNGQVYAGSALAANNLYYDERTVGRDEYLADDQSQAIALVERNGKAGAWSLYRNMPFRVAYMGNGNFLWATAYDDQGGGFRASNIGVSSAWGTGSGDRFTYDGKTVYWGDNDFYEEWMTKALIQESAIIDQELAAWAMIYGDLPEMRTEYLDISYDLSDDSLHTTTTIIVEEART